MARRESASAPPSHSAAAINAFNYQASAEVFMTRSHAARKAPVTYRRFATAAEALRFAVEELPAPLLVGAVLEVLEDRFDHQAIHKLYAQPGYPFARKIDDRG